MRATTPSRRGMGIAAAAALTVAACAGASSNGGSTSEVDEVSTTITDDPVTLTLAYTTDPPTEALVDGFTTEHPNVTIETELTSFNDYIKSIKLAMSSQDPPDIAHYNPGAMHSLVPAGLILDLDPWADAYGWDSKFPPSSLEILRSDEQGKEFGTGGLYAAPAALSVLGVFYNKSLLAEAGISEPPTTLSDFEAAMQKVKDAGHDPLSVGALGVGGFHIWCALLNVVGDVDDYRAWAYGQPGATIENDATMKATQILESWRDHGFIPESANATADADAQADFAQGRSAFQITGNWAAAALEEEMGDNVGFFLMPTESGEPATVASGASVPYAISSATENPDVAAAFLDYLSSPEAARIQYESGFMPVNTHAELDAEGVREEIATSFVAVAENDGIVPFPDFASPGMIDKLTPGVQGILSGSTSSEDFLQSLQESWDEYHGS